MKSYQVHCYACCMTVYGYAMDTDIRPEFRFERVEPRWSMNRGVIWGGLGSPRPRPPPQGKRKKKKKEKERKKRKKIRTKKGRKNGTMNNVKLLHIKCCFFQFFNSPVALKTKILVPSRKSWNDAPVNESWARSLRRAISYLSILFRFLYWNESILKYTNH